MFFVERHKTERSAADIKTLINVELRDVTAKSLGGLQTLFTGVADCSFIMRCLFNASVSQSRIPYGCCWVRFIRPSAKYINEICYEQRRTLFWNTSTALQSVGSMFCFFQGCLSKLRSNTWLCPYESYWNSFWIYFRRPNMIQRGCTEHKNYFFNSKFDLA